MSSLCKGSASCKALIDIIADPKVQISTRSGSPLHTICKRILDAVVVDLLVDSSIELNVQRRRLGDTTDACYTHLAYRLIELGANLNATKPLL